jgi:SNF2 family DNA or RNA helicase
MNFFAEDPKTKIIIYTQWNPIVRILAKVCECEGWEFEKYTGSMSTEAKDRAIDNFSNDPKINVLIAGLKCGGLGLNLTAATKVLLIDPWWNKAIEQQAFCRIFRCLLPTLRDIKTQLTYILRSNRIGQESPTSLTRFVCRNSIDEAMMQVKERKQIEIDELMNNSKLREKLTVQDLMRLFGKVEEDEDGKPFIFADERSDDGIPRLADLDEDNEFGFMNSDE